MSKYKIAAKELLHRRTSDVKSARLDDKYRPNDLEDALQIQAAMIAIHDDVVGGWKCLLPIDEDTLIVAPIFSSSIQRGTRCEVFSDGGCVRVEPEIAFVLNKSLPAKPEGYTENEINDAIGSCHMALELIQSRYTDTQDVEFCEKLADGLFNQGLYIGPEIEREKAFAATQINITIEQDTHVQTFSGQHPNPTPQGPIYWLINYMTRRGTSFEAGEAIITGSYCGVVDVKFDTPTTISYEAIGEYELTFSKKS